MNTVGPSYGGGPPPQQPYSGGAPQQPYPGGAPAQPYSGGAPGQPYPAGQPAGAYQGGGYPGGQPAGGYPGGQPAGGYPGGQPAGGYPGGQPAGGYPGGQPGAPPPGQGYPPGAPPPAGAAPENVNVQWKGEIPDDDVDDNPNAAPPQPSAPALEKMDEVAGYSNVGFDSAMLPPPSYDEAMKGAPPQREAVTGLPQIDEDEARQALLQHVAEHCCYGKGAAQTLQFTDLNHSSAFHYTLETFGEGRSTSWAFQPYTGQPIDGPHNGPAPGAWDIQANPPAMFQNQRMEVEVPHTASVKPCHNCMAMGRIRCHRCYGRGRVRCTSCGGRGHKTVYRNGEHEHERCTWCHGDGRRRCMTCHGCGMVTCMCYQGDCNHCPFQKCMTCHGCGMVTCMCCQGHCNLKCYIKLTINWTNHLQDHIVERTALPDALIRNVSGQVAFEESQPRVWPINHFPDAEINNASQNIVNQHAHAFPTEKLLMQRHRVRIIPVTQVLYKWKGDNSDYFVYGFEKKVYAPNYPQQCCCGCAVL